MFVHFVYMLRKYLFGQNCKNKVFGLNKIVDDFDYSILHLLMESNLLYKNEVDFWYGIYSFYFYFVEKLDNFHFDLVRIVVDHESLLNLKSFVVCFDFVNISNFEYSSEKILLFLVNLLSYTYVLQNYLFVMFVVFMMVLLKRLIIHL